MESLDELKKFHQTSWKGIWAVLKTRQIFRKKEFIFSLSLSILSMILALSSGFEKSFCYVKGTSNLILDFFPDLFGFSLGGFAIVVGFSNNEVIKNNSETNKYSLYQVLNAVFSLCLIVQVITTILSFLISWVVSFDFQVSLYCLNIIGFLLNVVLLGILVFGALYSILLTPTIISNLFSLAQVNNLFFTLQKISDEKKKPNENRDGQTEEGKV